MLNKSPNSGRDLVGGWRGFHSAKGQLDIYNIIHGLYTIINLKISLLYRFIEFLVPPMVAVAEPDQTILWASSGLRAGTLSTPTLAHRDV